MTIPMVILAVLCILAAVLVLVRFSMASPGKRMRALKGGSCETGTCKTIGTREVQEDEFGIEETESGLMAVLADGRGKQLCGKIAGRIAVETFKDIFQDENAFYNPPYYLRKAFQAANQEILNQLDEKQGSAAVATILIKDRKLYYATAGNVKVAVYRNRELVPVTSGHTINVLARQKYSEGKLTRQEAVALLDHHRLYNFVGQDGFHDVEFFDAPITLYGGEYVLLMSDGLYETARWKDLEECLEGGGGCQEKALQMIELVNRSEEDEKDNAAVVVIKIR